MSAQFAQRCYLVNVYGSYLVLVVVVALVAWRQGPLSSVFVGVVGALGLYAYVRFFPAISPRIGYGSVADRETAAPASSASAVRLYTAVGCPFCPIVRHRLVALRDRMGFRLEEIDVTLRPDVLLKRGIRAVPVVEVDDRVRIGHATTDELAVLISGRSTP